MTQDKDFKTLEIYTAYRIENCEYEFSDEAFINVGGESYSLRKRAIYDNKGTLMGFSLYKSEGIIEYQKEDLKNDLSLAKYLGIPLNQNWAFVDNRLKIGDETINVQRVNDSLFKKGKNGEITFYKIK